MIRRGSSTGKIQSYTQASGKVYDIKTGKLIEDPNLEDLLPPKKTKIDVENTEPTETKESE